MLVLRTLNVQRATIFFGALVQKSVESVFSTFWDKSRESEMKRKETKRNRQNFNCLFSTNPLVYRKKFTDDYYPSGYFRHTGTMG